MHHYRRKYAGDKFKVTYSYLQPLLFEEGRYKLTLPATLPAACIPPVGAGPVWLLGPARAGVGATSNQKHRHLTTLTNPPLPTNRSTKTQPKLNQPTPTTTSTESSASIQGLSVNGVLDVSVTINSGCPDPVEWRLASHPAVVVDRAPGSVALTLDRDQVRLGPFGVHGLKGFGVWGLGFGVWRRRQEGVWGVDRAPGSVALTRDRDQVCIGLGV